MPLTNDVPIYIGAMTDFYRLFEVDHRNKHEHFGIDRKWINYSELMDWYNIIKKYLQLIFSVILFLQYNERIMSKTKRGCKKTA